MIAKGWVLVLGLAMMAALASPAAQGGDIKIRLPRRSRLTPVQRLNREGVDAVRKHKYSQAEKSFYKAYLLDPDDPFTLNNLGYISELQGDADRAARFYSLAGEQATDAVIDLASTRRLQGRSLKEALAVTGAPLEVNHANVEAVRLLSQGRAPEADLLLQKALQADPANVFTLNNMGVTKEMEGEAEEALKFYDEAAGARSDAPAVVTVNASQRGRPVSEMAANSAKALRARLSRASDVTEQVAELNLRGVSAVNRNDLPAADQAFRKAYALNPNDAFTLNNIAYVAELDGDRETAQFFYDRARQAGGANLTVGVATRRTEEGKRLFNVAADNNTLVENKLTQEREKLQTLHEPVVLRRRDNSIVEESTQAAPPASNPPANNQPQQ